jgi:hypothetical protein
MTPFKETHWPNCGPCPGAVRFETDTVRDILFHETGLGTTILRSFAGHPFVHLAISHYRCAPGPEHRVMLQSDTATMGNSLVVLPMIDSEKIMLMIHDYYKTFT